MDYRDSVDLSDSHIQRGSGGGGRGGRMALGGGVGGVVLMLLVVFVGPSLGINVSDLLGSGGSQNTQGAAGQGDSLEHCRQKDVNVNTNRECRWALYDKVVQDYWSKAKSNYSYGTMKLFSGTTSTACGSTPSATVRKAAVPIAAAVGPLEPTTMTVSPRGSWKNMSRIRRM